SGSMRRLIIGFGLSISLVLSLPGCSKGPDQPLVSGLVTLDDKPLADATIHFFPVPTGPEATAAAFGAVTDAEGRYKTVAKPGSYKIVVLKWTRKDGQALDLSVDDPGQLEWQPSAEPNSPYLLVVPSEYARADSTPLTRAIVTGSETIDLPLQTGARNR